MKLHDYFGLNGVIAYFLVFMKFEIVVPQWKCQYFQTQVYTHAWMLRAYLLGIMWVSAATHIWYF